MSENNIHMEPIEVEAYSDSHKMSDHFTLGEFIISQTATRLNIINYPTDKQYQSIQSLCVNVLEPIRSNFGSIIISSGLRADKLNTAIGGSKTSQHCFGEAGDIISPTYSVTEMYEWIVLKSDIVYDQIIHEFGKWIHISYTNRYVNRMRRTTAKKMDGITKYAHWTREQITDGLYL